MLVFEIMFMIFFAIQFGDDYLNYYNLLTNIILTSAVVLNLFLSLKFTFFIHFIGVLILTNFMSLLVLYKF